MVPRNSILRGERIAMLKSPVVGSGQAAIIELLFWCVGGSDSDGSCQKKPQPIPK